MPMPVYLFIHHLLISAVRFFVRRTLEARDINTCKDRGIALKLWDKFYPIIHKNIYCGTL